MYSTVPSITLIINIQWGNKIPILYILSVSSIDEVFLIEQNKALNILWTEYSSESQNVQYFFSSEKCLQQSNVYLCPWLTCDELVLTISRKKMYQC